MTAEVYVGDRRAVARVLALVAVLAASACTGGDGAGDPSRPHTPPPPAAGDAQPVPNDCSRDVSDALNAWLAAQRPGATAILEPGCYLVDSTLFVRQPLVLVAHGATIRAPASGSGVPVPAGEKRANWPRARRHLSIRSDDVTVRGLTIQGPNVDAVYLEDVELQSGVHIPDGVDRVTIEDVTVRNVYGDCVSLGLPEPSADVAIRRLTCDGAGRVGVSIPAGTNVVLEDSTLRRIPRSAIDIEPQLDAVVSGVVIRNNVIEAPGGPVLSMQGTGTVVQDVAFSGNRILGKNIWSKIGSPSRPTVDVRLVGNTSDAIGDLAISVRHVDGLVVEGNVNRVNARRCGKTTCSAGIGLLLEGVVNAQVGENDFGAGEVVVLPAQAP
jgi:hypothetical protein